MRFDSPGPPHRLTEQQRAEAIDALEAKLGFAGHPRVVVLHEKLGREHIHVVWSRINLEKMKSVSDSHNYRKHEEVARDLERRFGHERVQGAHHERDGVKRPDRTPSRAELRQEERTGIKGKTVKAEVTKLFRACDNAQAFKASLENAGYILAQGDRRDFVIVDRAGGIHSLARRIDVVRAPELRAFMSPIDRSTLPTTEQAKVLGKQRKHDLDEQLKEKGYSRGAGLESQSKAALKDHIARQKALDKTAEAIRTFDYGKPREDEIKSEDARLRRQADETTQRQNAKHNALSPSTKPETSAPNGIEMTDAQRMRMDRLLRAAKSEDREQDRDGPDRQREAPGGGRTRSR